METGRKNEDETLRRFTGRGRWAVEPFTVVLRDKGYELSDGTELSLDVRVLLHVERNPGMGQRDIIKRVGGRSANIADTLRRLSDRRAIENRGTDSGQLWYPVVPQTEIGLAR